MKNLLAWMGRHKNLGLLAAILLVSWACDPASDATDMNCAEILNAVKTEYENTGKMLYVLKDAYWLADSPMERAQFYALQQGTKKAIKRYNSLRRDGLKKDCPIVEAYPEREE